jgi:dipeptidyl aminopeptidase/acylaminoacyl peptidase
MTVRSVLAIMLLLGMAAAWADETDLAPESAETAEAEDGTSEVVDDGLTFDDLFRSNAISKSRLSPDGELVAYFRYDMLVVGNLDAGYSDIRGFHSRLSIKDLTWIGPSTLWVDSWDPKNDRFIGTAVRFRKTDEGGMELDEARDHFSPGYISDRLQDNDDLVELARPRFEDEVLSAEIYTINVLEPLENQLTAATRVDTGSESFFYYRKNAAGDYVQGIRIAEGVPEVWRRLPDGETWEIVWSAEKESTFVPWFMSEDGKTSWVLSDATTDRVAAMEFDLEKGEFVKVLFQHERVDVDAILMSRDGSEPTGVIYSDRGLDRYHFFSEEDSAEFDRLQEHFPGQGIAVTGYSQESNRQLVFASSSNDPGSIHVCNLTSDQCELVAAVAPWLQGKLLSKTVALDIPSTDDIVVEAFLTLPTDSDQGIPLIALPHGGPIGVSDTRYFSSEVQWLAFNGYAVLQVNYRGSGGYGENFRNAGLRQWGRGIEDDIEAAVHKVLADYPGIDGDRVGIFGGSYGGYSAIMSVIRNPELFKCAASFAGVMDLTLLFKRSDVVHNEHLRELIVKYVGDPDIHYDEQTEYSPVYRYKEVTRPVLLGHGLDDPVVDFEHSWRMQKMLRLTGSPPEFVLLKGVGHGFDFVNEAQDFYGPLLEFLDKHLKPDVEVPPSPADGH